MVESAKVERRGCGTVGDLGLWDDQFISSLQRVTNFIRAQGATPGIQIGHSVRSIPPAITWWLGKRAKPAFEGVPSTYRHRGSINMH